MQERHLFRLQPLVTAGALLFAITHLAWEYFNGGVVSHHLLARDDLPAISNWWGLLLLPVLAWFLSGWAQTRIATNLNGVLAGSVGALACGVLLSVSFASGREDLAAYVLQGMLLLALLLPVYRAEYVFGFIVGMTFTFGAVLPALVAALVGAVSAIAHLVVRPLLSRVWQRLRRAH